MGGDCGRRIARVRTCKEKQLIMKIIVQRLYDLFRTILTINQLSLEKTLKRKIMATWFRVFLFKRYDHRNKVADIVGFKVKFLDYSALSYLFREIFLGHEYYFVAKKDTPLIVDCGSNIGMSVLYFKMLYPDSRIEAFEPGKETYSSLEENIRNNHLNSVVTRNGALSNREGVIDFYYDQDNTGSLIMSTRKERMPKQKQSVDALLLSKYMDEEVDFLKIDIEGAETEVVEELIKAGKLDLVDQMVIEYHHHIPGESDVFSGMLRLLEDAGFGYQIEGRLDRPLRGEQVQDILIYAYKRKPGP